MKNKVLSGLRQTMKLAHLIFFMVSSFMVLSSCNSTAQELTLVSNGTTAYKIVTPAEATPQEKKAAAVLQKYLEQATGAKLPIVSEDQGAGASAIYMGRTKKGMKAHAAKLQPEGYLIQTEGNNLMIMGGSGKGLLYGTYSFLENYVGCKKLSNAPAIVPTIKLLKIPALNEEHKQQFEYREVYYPASMDAEYLDWNQLHRFEDLWGLWGHSYDKLVPARSYFAQHPEYYAMVKGKRQPTQLCLSNDEVYKIVKAELTKRIAENEDAIYWSFSPNDDIGYCECDKCKAIDNEQGTPAASLIKFVNRLAGAFPDKKLTTLAYGYTHRAPKSLRPAENVYIFLSNIDAYRDKPLAAEGTAAAFRADLKGWGALTKNIFVWDYITQFTNYLAPFPINHTLQANMQFLKENGVKGIFAQGSGETYGECAEMRSYLEAKLMQDVNYDVKNSTFITDFYGPKAGPYIQEYQTLLHAMAEDAHRKLDIYGNPANEWATYLNPDKLDRYSSLFDKAEAAAEANAIYAERVMKARLPLEYTVYQQARVYGIEKFGIFVQDNAGNWSVKPKFQDKIKRFVANCKKAGVTEMSEGGPNPDQYLAEWEAIYKAGVTPTKAIGASVILQHPFAPDYPAKGTRTLVDGNPGYADFSYNWLCFYGVPMIANIDIGELMTVKSIKMHFLDDPRHWIFIPEKIKIEVSEDGGKFRVLDDINTGANEEHYELKVKEYAAQNKGGKVRYIRVTAANGSTLPSWRFKEGKKPMIACDEIYVQ